MDVINETYLYPYSLDAAKRGNKHELEAYIESHKENVRCAGYIEEIISADYDGYSLKSGSAKKVIAKYGYDRVNWVLAYNIQQKSHDGRISKENAEWAKKFFIPEDIVNGYNRRNEYLIDKHNGLLNIFTNEAREEYQALNLFDSGHCNAADELNFEGRLMVLNPLNLPMHYKSPDYQLIYCTGGFGCSPKASGRCVYGTFLADEHECDFDRNEFIGELKEEYIPEWAAKALKELRKENEVIPEQEGGNIEM